MSHIRKTDLLQLKPLLNKEDIEAIAAKVERSTNTVNAVFWSRPHEATEREIVQLAEEKIASLLALTNRLQSNSDVSIQKYREKKALATWQQGEDFYLFVDIYTQMAHIDFKSERAILEHLRLRYGALLKYPFRVIELLVRLTGCTDFKALREVKEFQKQSLN